MNNEVKKVEIDLVAIEEKKKRLEQIKKELKQEFVGIDYVIDELINYIQIWYLMPEVLSRPIIIGLWGMTGVGKTDLIRKLVTKIDYQDRFAEVELSNSDSSSYYSWKSSVGGILDTYGMNDGLPSIILFDEIQRFNTIDTEGAPIANVKFQDFWELLSDGKLAKRDVKEDIDGYLENYYHQAREKKKEKEKAALEKGEEVADSYAIGLWEARKLKKLFNLTDEVVDIANLKPEDLLDIMMEKKKKKKIYEAINHSKSLIIISGNLDEAFSMSSDTSESDIDADIFNAYTRKITLVDIKNALAKKFKPEQVARFGNIHLIYRSLMRKDFEKLIEMEVAKIIAANKLHFDIELKVSKNINELIYKNGVFPVQGVRPVFSGVTDVLESNLAQVLFEALITFQNKVSIDYDSDKKQIVAKFGNGKKHKINYVGRIDKIRQSNLQEVVANVSVHESGHAVVYGILFGMAPLQLKSKVASTYVGGFTFPHQIHQTKQTIINKIKVFLSGGLAEEIIFGAQNATIGRENDRWEATVLVIDYIRKYGFEDDFQIYYNSNPAYQLDVYVTDKVIEAMMKKLVVETKELLETNKALLIDISKELFKHGSLKAKEVSEIATRHNHNFEVKEESHLYVNNYVKQLE
jgi:GTPase SAR1 family protein